MAVDMDGDIGERQRQRVGIHRAAAVLVPDFAIDRVIHRAFAKRAEAHAKRVFEPTKAEMRSAAVIVAIDVRAGGEIGLG